MLFRSLAYSRDPPPVPRGVEPQRVLRGGSWADGPEACTVSFRMSRPPEHSDTPTVGFRLVRVERSA